MKALLCKSLDGPESLVIEDLPEPVAAPGEVVIAVKTVSLNFFDTLITRGKYQMKPPLPFSPGGEVAGVIKSVGAGITNLKPGQRVAASVGVNGFREEIAAPAQVVIPIPDGVSYEIAAALPIAYGTALHGLTDRGRLAAGETLLVLGATGGTGLAALEIGVKMGAKVIAAGTSDEKLKLCAERGAAHCLNLTGVDIKTTVRDLTGGKGVDVVYDCIGGPHAEPSLRALAWAGRYLVIGFAAGEIPKIPLNLVLLKESDILGVFWGQHVERNPDAFASQMKQLLAWCAAGDLRPYIEWVQGLDRAADAIRRLENREFKGKAVITL